MDETFSRARMVMGDEAIERLARCSVAVFGIGGVGSYIAEALARGGVGRLLLIDSDRVAQSNINRQLIALRSTVGRLKVEVMAERIRDINPAARVETYPVFYGAETAEQIPFSGLDYISDAIDTVSSKLLLIRQAAEAGVPIISSMGTGNKLDPSRLELTDLSKTSVCPLARVMRRELGRRGVKHLRVVYSPEEPAYCAPLETPPPGRRSVPGSVPWVPPVAGLLLGGAVVMDLVGDLIPQKNTEMTERNEII